MKNFLFFFLLFISTSFLSCEKEEIGSVSSSNMSIYGTSIPIKSGVILESNKNVIIETVEYVWKDQYTDKTGEHTDDIVGFFRSDNRTETGNFMLSLHGEGLSFIPDLVVTQGEGAIISLHLASSDLKQLVPGKYKFSDSKLPNTFIGYLSSSFNMTGTSKAIATIVDGEVNVVNEGGDNYSVDANVKIASGVNVTCNYKGVFEKSVVNQPKMAKMEGIALNGLLPTITTKMWFNPMMGQETMYMQELDLVDKAFLSIASGAAQSAKSNKASVEIALALDSVTGIFTFLSPIKARSILGHKNSNNFPCHTIFMKAPASFGDSDYANLEKTGMNIAVTEEVVTFSLNHFEPGYVLFDAGNGTKGVLRVKGVLPSFEVYKEEMQGMIRFYNTMSEQLLCDVKATTNFGNPKLR